MFLLNEFVYISSLLRILSNFLERPDFLSLLSVCKNARKCIEIYTRKYEIYYLTGKKTSKEHRLFIANFARSLRICNFSPVILNCKHLRELYIISGYSRDLCKLVNLSLKKLSIKNVNLS